MAGMFSGNPMLQLVGQSDLVTSLVLLTLLIMSIVCWSIFLYKIVLLRLKKRHMKAAIKRLYEAKNLDDMVHIVSEFSSTLPGYFLSKNFSFLKIVLEEHGSTGQLSAHEWELIQDNMDQVLDTVVSNEESYLTLLLTCAQVSTLLGLFGTVWGLVHAFIGISQSQSADIAAVAPGIAEALITTLAGLIVAIPAQVMFNYLQSQVRTIERQCVALADRFGFIVQKSFIR